MALDLASLAARARAKVAIKDDARAAETRAKNARTVEARTAALVEVQAIREHIDWVAVAILHVTEHWHCRCGAIGEAPQGLFILQEHTRLANSRRLQRPRHESALPDNLPRHVKIEKSIVLMCQDCREGLGFITEWAPPIPATALAYQEKGSFTEEWETLTAPLPQETGNDELEENA